MKKLRQKRIVRHTVFVVLASLAALGLYALTHWSSAGPVYWNSRLPTIQLPHRLRNSVEHDAAWKSNGGNPYVFEIRRPVSGSLLYYGASHSRDPDHPQLRDIETRWTRFQPTVALYEGRSRGFFVGTLFEPFLGLPEPALVHRLARRDGVPLYSLEPPYDAEVAELLKRFKAEQVSLYFFLRVYVSETGGESDERLARDLLAKRTDLASLHGSLPSLAAVDRVWQRDFAQLEDWRTITGELDYGYLADISEQSRRIRGQHMLRTLIDLVGQGERVFAVVGSGHVIRQEWNLRELLGLPPAWDQPDPRQAAGQSRAFLSQSDGLGER